MRANAVRRQAHDLWKSFFEMLGKRGMFTVKLYVDGCRLSHANGVRELNIGPIDKTRSDNIFREVARGISSRAVNLRRIFPRERAAAVWGHAAISIDDNFTSCQARISVRTANNEFTRWVDVKNCIFGNPAFWHDFGDVRHNDV